MKLSLKSSSLFAAVAMSIYSAFVIIAERVIKAHRCDTDVP